MGPAPLWPPSLWPPSLWPPSLGSVLLALFAAAFLIYGPTLHYPFIFDDTQNITDNYRIWKLEGLWPPEGTRYMGYLSFALNYAAGGLDPWGYRLVNVLIHITNGVFVYLLVTTLWRAAGGKGEEGGHIAFLAALLFVCHPVQTQAVVYVTQRFASLATFFYLISVVFYLKARSGGFAAGPSSRKALLLYVVSVASAVLAMKTKEISFTLPFVMVLFEFVLFKGRSFRERALSLTPFIMTLAIIPLTLFVGGGGADAFGRVREAQLLDLTSLSRGDYMATELRVVVTYLRLLILPIDQNLDYAYPIYKSLFDPPVFASFLFIFTIAAAAVALLIRSRRAGSPEGVVAALGVIWFFVALSVESSVVPIRDVIFEHRLYLPSVGAAAAFSVGAFYLARRLGVKTGATLLAALLFFTVLPLGIAAHMRAGVWSDAVSLWGDVARKSPMKPRGHVNLGFALKRTGDYDGALAAYDEALRFAPGEYRAMSNRGVLYFELGRVDDAIADYRRALEINPRYAAARSNLGAAYFSRGLTEEAVSEYAAALADYPDLVETRTNLGFALLALGRTDEAIGELTKALALDPGLDKAQRALRLARSGFFEGDGEVGFTPSVGGEESDVARHMALGSRYEESGFYDEAVEEFERAAALDRALAEPYNRIGNLYRLKGMADEAIDSYRRALSIAPADALVRVNLGNVYMDDGRPLEAMEEFTTAAELDPAFAEARSDLGRALASVGRLEAAVVEFTAATKLRPSYAEAHFNLGLAQMKLGRLEEARRALTEGLKYRPSDAAARRMLEELTGR